MRKKLFHNTKTVLLFLVLLVFLIPVWNVLAGSFMSDSELAGHTGALLSAGEGVYADWSFLPLQPSGWSYLRLLLDTPEYFVTFWNSVLVTAISVVAQAVVAVLAAWGIGVYRFPYRKHLLGLYVFLMMLPFQVLMLPQYFIMKNLHIYDTFWALIIPEIFSPYAVFLLVQNFKTLQQEDAAYRNAVSNLETTEEKQQAAVDAAEKELNARKGEADATAEEIAEAQKAYEDAVSEMEVAVSEARSQVESASIRSAGSTTAEQLKITRMQTEEKKKSLEGMLEQDGKKCAECSGYIKEVNISVGNDTTGDADVIVTRMDGGMSVEVTISDTEKQYLSAGEQVQVYKEQDAETAGDCEVLSVEKNADTGAWNVLVDVSGLDVKIGDNVGVQILNESEYYPFLIPREALHYKSGGKYFVYIAEETETVMGTETRAAAQEVEVLDMDDMNVAIERISLQTPVIIDSDRQISEDRRVNCEKNET